MATIRSVSVSWGIDGQQTLVDQSLDHDLGVDHAVADARNSRCGSAVPLVYVEITDDRRPWRPRMNDIAIKPGVHQLAVGDCAAGRGNPVRLGVKVGVNDFAPVSVPPCQVDLLVEFSSNQPLNRIENRRGLAV